MGGGVLVDVVAGDRGKTALELLRRKISKAVAAHEKERLSDLYELPLIEVWKRRHHESFAVLFASNAELLQQKEDEMNRNHAHLFELIERARHENR